MDQWKRSVATGLAMSFGGIVCLGTLAGACFAGDAPGPSSGQDPRQAVVTPPPENFDVIGTNSAHAARILGLVHERLLQWNPQTQSIEPGVAELPKTDDKKTWKLTLRPAKTPEGHQVTAEDVAVSLDLITSRQYCPENYTQFSIAGRPIKAEPVDGGRAGLIRLDTPTELLPRILTGVPVLPSHVFKAIAKGGDEWRRGLDQTAPTMDDKKFLRDSARMPSRVADSEVNAHPGNPE